QYGDVDSATRLFSSTANKSNYIYIQLCSKVNNLPDYLPAKYFLYTGLISNNMAEKVFDLLDEMEINPNSFTLAILFKACAELVNDRAIKIGRKLLDEMPENYRNDVVVLTSAMHMLMKFGDIQSAERYVGNEMFERASDLFEQIHLNFDSVTYTVVFNACAGLANDRAMKIEKKLLAKMPENYRNDNITSTSAIDMLMKFGDVESAERIFRSIKAKGAIIYGALMNGYNLNGESWKCFKIFEEMKEKDIIPDEIVWNILIGACSKSGMLHHCQYIVKQIPLNIQNKIRIQNALIDMWVNIDFRYQSVNRLFIFCLRKGKCGSIENAKNVFNLVVDRDTITYTAMINAFGLNGMGSQAAELYREMPNNLRDHVSQICVLNACSHAGLLHEARTIFNEISLKTESIITTMV
ncbi:unnamed protein product, partial [Rotaria magnacalcarata]